MNRRILAAGLAAGMGGAFLAAWAAVSPLDQLVASERSFAFRSAQLGMRAAFVEFMTAESVVFRPLPTNGRTWAFNLPETRDSLLWEPDFARISRRADFGVSSGPWVYVSVDSAGGTERGYGHFLSVWEKEKDGPRVGQMRVVLDIGVSHPRPEAPPSNDFRADSVAGEPPLLMGPSRVQEEKGVLLAERNLAARSAGGKFGAALASVARPDLRLYRPGVAPSVGVTPALELLAADRSRWKWTPDRVRVAESGDLAYSYGVAHAPVRTKARPDSATFVRIWQRDPGAEWRVLVDLQIPVRRGG